MKRDPRAARAEHYAARCPVCGACLVCSLARADIQDLRIRCDLARRLLGPQPEHRCDEARLCRRSAEPRERRRRDEIRAAQRLSRELLAGPLGPAGRAS